MNALTGKGIFYALIVAGFAGIYWRTPLGDRWFALGVWLVFSLVVGTFVYFLPLLYCPSCRRATGYFDNYTERQDALTGGHRRFLTCKHCHSVIDRLNGGVVHQWTAEDGKTLQRVTSLLYAWIVLLAAGTSLMGVSIFSGIIVALIALEKRANHDRVLVVSLACGGVFFLGLVLALIGWGMKRRAHRAAGQHRISFLKRIRKH